MTETLTPTNDSLAIALAAMNRGLYNKYIDLVPLNDDGKEIRKGFPVKLLDLPRTEESVRLIAAVFPTAPLGIRGRRGIDGIIVVDIDQEGVIERIEKETGRPFPKTYMTQTRPHTKPWKRHVYFWSTELSVSLFEKQRYCGEYDLKCQGGAGHVAAEGCWRPSGNDVHEQITGNDLLIIPIPEYLARYLDEDSQKLVRELKARESEVRKELARRNETSEKRTVLILEGDRRRTLRSHAASLINGGMPRDRILRELRLQLQSGDYENGLEWSKTAEGKEALKKIAFDKGLKPRPRRQPRPYRPAKPKGEGLVVRATPSAIETARLMDIIRGFESRVTSAHAYGELGLDKTKRTDQGRLRALMRDGGFAPTVDGRRWERLITVETPMSPNPYGDQPHNSHVA